MTTELVDLTEKLQEEYLRLILWRDQFRKEAKSIEIAYFRVFGSLLIQDYELKIACIRQKKIIAWIVLAINHRTSVDMDDVSWRVRQEMKSWDDKLKDLKEDTERSREARMSTEYTVRRVKKIYRQIAKMIHPDIFPEARNNETISNLWARVQEAYAVNDLKAMEELLVLVQDAVAGMKLPAGRFTPEELKRKIAELKQEISRIVMTNPYRYKDILSDERATRLKKEELQKEIDAYTQYLNQLKSQTEDLMARAGATMSWVINNV